MVNAKKVSAEEQANNASIVQLEKTYKEQLKLCRQLLNRHESARAPVLAYMKANKWTLTSPVAERPMSFEAQARAARKGSAKAKAQAASAAASSVDKKDMVPTNFNTLGRVSYQSLIEKVLPGIHRSLLSKGNVEAMMPKKALAPEKQVIALHLIEFLTGYGPSFSLTGEHNRWSVVNTIFNQAMTERGRLCPDAEMPPKYETEGVYCILDAQKDCLILQHRFSKEKVKLTAECFSFVPRKFEEVELKDNWSETQAFLHYHDNKKGSKRSFRVTGFFKTQLCKKRKSGVLDGSSPASSSSKRSNKSGSSP